MSELVPNGSSSRPGPKPDPFRAFMRQQFADWSDRTFARWWKAHQRLKVLMEVGAIDGEAGYKDVTARAARANGSVNVNKLDRISEEIAAMWVIRQEEGGPWESA